MNSEEKFKTSLNDLVGSRSFDLDEENWDRMQRILDIDRARRRGGIGIFLSGLAVITFGLFVQSMSTASAKHPMTLLAPTELATSEKTASRPDRSSAPAHIPSTEATIPAVHASAKSPSGIEATQPAASRELPVNSKPSTIAPSDNHLAQITKSQPPASGIMPQQIPARPKEEQAQNISENAPFSTNGSTVHETPVTPEPVVLQSAAPVLTPSEVAVPETLNTPETPKKEEFLVDSLPELLAMPAPPSIPSSVLLLSFEGGPSMIMGWKVNGQWEGNSINPMVGINYYTPVNDRSYVSIGLQYNRVGNLSQNPQISKVRHYGFGEESDVTVITPWRLHYLTIPVRYHFYVTPKDVLSGGIFASYLLNVDAKVQEYHEKNGNVDNMKSYTSSGYVDGMRWFDLQMTVGYRRTIYGNFSAGGDIFVGMNDVKDNNFFATNHFERLIGLKLVIQYNIFKKY